MNFNQKLNLITTKNNSLVCVGLDSDPDKIPHHLKKESYSVFEFNKQIIDSTHDLVCAYKPNTAFYEAFGNKGIVELRMTCEYIQQKYPEIPVIIDAKRGDIGNTNEGYAKYIFDYLEADAATVMPYMGIESLAPYFKRVGKGIIIGCHSSNPGAKEFQELLIDGKPLYQIVAEQIIKLHGDNPNCMIFMGATFPDQIAIIRKIVGDMTMLVPGVGAQEGSLEKTIRAGLNTQKAGLIINSSRSIIFASPGEDFAAKSREATVNLKNEINKYRK